MAGKASLRGNRGRRRGFDLGMITGDEHVDGRNDKEGKNGADGHASHEHPSDLISGFGAGACCRNQRKVTGDGCRGLKTRLQGRGLSASGGLRQKDYFEIAY